MSRIVASLLLLLTLLTFNQNSIEQKQERIGPGVGANTEDPRKILRAAGQAMSAADSLTYEADYRGVGAMATHSPVAQGKITLARLAPNNPFKAKIFARGMFSPTGSDELTLFHSTFDGRTLRKLRPGERTLMVRSLSDRDPKERSFGFVTSWLGGGAYHLLMLDYVLDNPLARQAEAAVADYEGRTVVDGVLCHVIYVEYASDTKGRTLRERWFVGAKDNLPRKVEQLVTSDEGRSGAYVLTLSKVVSNPRLDPSAFTMRVPKGYVIKPTEAPTDPALLALGEPAPDWKLTDPDGNVHSLSDYRGKIVVLDFWATWCGPCIRAMPSLQKLSVDYKDRGVVVLGLNTWEESNAVEFMKRSGYTYGLLLKAEEAAAAYRVSKLPTLYVINVDGTIIHRLSGIDENLSTVIERYLKEQGR